MILYNFYKQMIIVDKVQFLKRVIEIYYRNLSDNDYDQTYTNFGLE